MSGNKKTTCLQSLRTQILSLAIAPGSDLDEARLCAEFNLSRTPLREVFQRLNGEGYIEIAQNKGAKVSSMDLPQMRNFFQTAPLIYATVARLAAENRTPRQLSDLKEVQTRFQVATKAADPLQSALMNHRFHEIIGEMAHNPYLTPSLNRMLIDHTRLSQTFYRPQSPAEAKLVATASDQHDLMIEAIAAHAAATAVDLTLKHWDLSRDRLERFVRPDPLPLNIQDTKDQAHAI